MQPTEENLNLMAGFLSRFQHLRGIPVNDAGFAGTVKAYLRICHNMTPKELSLWVKLSPYFTQINPGEGAEEKYRAELCAKYAETIGDGPSEFSDQGRTDLDWLAEYISDLCSEFPQPAEVREIYRKAGIPRWDGRDVPTSVED